MPDDRNRPAAYADDPRLARVTNVVEWGIGNSFHEDASPENLAAQILKVLDGDALPIDTIREESGDRRPPRDPRNGWRVLAANGWSREVASEGNAQEKAAGYDRGCPPRECPHRVQRWTGSEWVDVARTVAAFDLHDAVAQLDTESDFGHAKSYEWLRDVALLCFNPADDDGAEEEIVERALVDAADYIAARPCECTNSDPEGDDRSVPYDEGDQCARCRVLGRYFDEPVER